MYQEAVRNGVLFLKQTQETWTTVRALLRLFAWVVARKGLSFTSGLEDLDSLDANTDELGFSSNVHPPGQPQDDGTINPLLFSIDPFLDLQDWNDIAMLRAL